MLEDSLYFRKCPSASRAGLTRGPSLQVKAAACWQGQGRRGVKKGAPSSAPTRSPDLPTGHWPEGHTSRLLCLQSLRKSFATGKNKHFCPLEANILSYHTSWFSCYIEIPKLSCFYLAFLNDISTEITQCFNFRQFFSFIFKISFIPAAVSYFVLELKAFGKKSPSIKEHTEYSAHTCVQMLGQTPPPPPPAKATF